MKITKKCLKNKKEQKLKIKADVNLDKQVKENKQSSDGVVDSMTRIDNYTSKLSENSEPNEDQSADYEEYTTVEYPMTGYSTDSIFNFEGEMERTTMKIPKNRPVRIYCDGVYDLFHYGHARQLKQAKDLFPNVYLMVGVTNDELTLEYKGSTVMSAPERYESVRHCRYVDEVVEDAPWIITPEFLQRHKIDYVAHDDVPYASADQDDIYMELKKQGKFIATRRTANISTSSLITRLLRDYDKYLRRQILRGISREDLNISSFKERQVRIKEKLNVELDGLKNDISEVLKKWERQSNIWLRNFIGKFEATKPDWIEKLVKFVKKRRIGEEEA
ncbi:choline-phosphate cytidylyltransferase [Pancytospora epiphaga]|nr:choline-phosphate cytidylyltransferase [Pancytospora epiphaga]